MRIAVITTKYPTLLSDHIGTFVRENALALGQEHAVTVIHFVAPEYDDDTKSFIDGPVRIRRFPNAMETDKDLADALRIVKMVSGGFDILHVMDMQILKAFAAGMPADLDLPKPWIFSARHQIAAPENWPAHLPTPVEVMAEADGVTLVSNSLKARYEAALAEKRLQTNHRTPPAVISFILPPPEQVPARAAQEGQMRLLAMGALAGFNQPTLAATAVQHLRQKGINATMRWLASELESNSNFEQKVTELELTDYVTYVLDLPEDGLIGEFSAADVFFLPTKKESFCTPAVRALQYGLPVVLGAAADGEEFINDDYCRIVDSSNPEDYAQAIIELHEKTANVPPQQIADSVAGLYDAASIAAQYTVVYDALAVRAPWAVFG